MEGTDAAAAAAPQDTAAVPVPVKNARKSPKSRKGCLRCKAKRVCAHFTPQDEIIQG